MTDDATGETMLSPAEIADFLHVSRAMVYKLLQRGVIPSMRIGTLVRVKKAELDRYVRDIGEQNALPTLRDA
jgi:excisionase family DNA binding protein